MSQGLTTEQLINRIEDLTRPANSQHSNNESVGIQYKNEIFLLEMPEGGDIKDLRAVGFTGWEGTLKNEPTKTVRFYAQVIAFEDTKAPTRNWQINTEKIKLSIHKQGQTLYKKLVENLL